LKKGAFGAGAMVMKTKSAGAGSVLMKRKRSGAGAVSFLLRIRSLGIIYGLLLDLILVFTAVFPPQMECNCM